MEMELPSTVECLYELAISDFEKYRDDEYCQLVEKCCYALGAIGTEEAKEKLKLLAKSDKDIIREHVEDTFEIYKLSKLGKRNCTQDNVVKEKYPDMPMPEKSPGWGYKFVRFKEEKRQINIQLGQEGGKALEIFNNNIIDYKIMEGQ